MEAFDTLMGQGDIHKITVSAIAREAEIDRKTFYLHYNSVEDLANYKTEKTIERILLALKLNGNERSDQERLHVVLEEMNAIIEEDIDFYTNLASSISVEQLLQRLFQRAESIFGQDGAQGTDPRDMLTLMHLQFYMAGAWSLYWAWLQSDRSIPIETISQAIEDAIADPIAKNPQLFKIVNRI